MSDDDDESQHDLPTEGGEIFAANGSETGEDDQTGSTFMASGRNNAYTHSLARKIIIILKTSKELY